ncbi:MULTISPECIES: hypothetical protein [unclassified Thioalkalivibrio]|uniref:hypothetical protein n=1 Tax=unclassified Thioalkalivibrio TaxID=2621013 RepID=UPI000368AE2A|nr:MULTISPECIES: hypothetical protein [unclassified Thioalkalivibrio]
MAVALTVAFVSYDSFGAYEDLRLTATTLSTIGATLTGFLLTALSLLIGVSNRTFIQNLRITGHFQVLVKGMFQLAGAWIVVIVVGLLGHATQGDPQRFWVAAGFGLTVIALALLLHVGRRFYQVILGLSSS